MKIPVWCSVMFSVPREALRFFPKELSAFKESSVEINSLLHGIYMSLFTQVYKWVPATYCWGVTQRWTSIPARGE